MPSTLQVFNKCSIIIVVIIITNIQCFLCVHTSAFESINSAVGSKIKASFLSSITTQEAELLSSFQTGRNQLLPSREVRSGTPGAAQVEQLASIMPRPLVEGRGPRTQVCKEAVE